MAQLRWSPRAVADLEAICEYIERDSSLYANLIAQRIVTAVEKIPDFPEAGSIVPEFDDSSVRERLVHRYRVVHRIVGDVVEIVTIIHGSARMPDLSEMS